MFAPLTQTLINHTGWTSALLILAASALLAIPLAALLDRYTRDLALPSLNRYGGAGECSALESTWYADTG